MNQIIISIIQKQGRRRDAEDSVYHDTKKTRLLGSIKEKIAALELHQSRIKYAMSSVSSFLPRNFFQNFPELDSSSYKASIDWEPLVLDEHTMAETINYTIMQLKELLVHAIIVNQNNDWVFISQIEVYYKDKTVDSVAFTSKHDTHSKDLVMKMERQTNEDGG